MRISWMLPLAALCSTPVMAQKEAFDTVAVIMGIEARMTAVEQLPLGGVYLRYADKEDAVALAPTDSVTGMPLERDELYVNPDGSIGGVVTYYRSPSKGVAESSIHYFAEDGHTVAASWTMRWLGSQCTDSIAVETRYVYFHPAGESILEYGTVKDQHGRKVDHTTCLYPDVERHFDAYYHRDMLLLSKHINRR